MIKSYEWILFKNLVFSKRNEAIVNVIAVFSFIGIMLGVATLIVIINVLNGYREVLFSKILGLNGHIVVTSIFNDAENSQGSDPIAQIKNLVKNDPEFDRAYATIESQSIIKSKYAQSGIIVKGVEIEEMLKTSQFKISTDKFDKNAFKQGNSVIIGKKLAQVLGVEVGEKVTLIFPDANKTPFGTYPASVNFSVAAIFSLGLDDYDRAFAFTDFRFLKKLLDKKSHFDYFLIYLKEMEQTEIATEKLKSILSTEYYLSNWKLRHASLFSALQTEKAIMFMILFLIVIIACFNIITGMIIFVREKKREIAILKTIGLSSTSILKIFTLMGASVGFIASGFGLLLGALILFNVNDIQFWISQHFGSSGFDSDIYFLSQIPEQMDFYETMIIIIFTNIIAILSSLYPSLKAASFDPATVLREI